MDEKELFKFDSFVDSPPVWEDPDDISPEDAASDAATWMEAAAAGGSGVRSRL